MGPDRWLTATPLGSRRVILEPLRIDHAEEMAPLLNLNTPRCRQLILESDS